MKTRSILVLVLAPLFAAAVACNDDSSAVKETIDSGTTTPTLDGGPGPGTSDGGDSGPKDCFDNPTTHFEIINACTTATRITKDPKLGKLLDGGALPPLN